MSPRGTALGPRPLSYSGPADTAEWIEELPAASSNPQPSLANFGPVTFTNMTTIPRLHPPSPSVDMVDNAGNLLASTGTISNSSFTITWAAIPRGYWLVGSDGGIFTFGSAQFYGSTGNLKLQRPVVGIVPTADRGGYW